MIMFAFLSELKCFYKIPKYFIKAFDSDLNIWLFQFCLGQTAFFFYDRV